MPSSADAPFRSTLTRRQAFRRAAFAAGALVGGGMLAGCSTHATHAPTLVPTRIQLIFQPLTTLPFATLASFLQAALSKFETAHPGIAVKIEPHGNTASNIAAIISGTGPDIVYDFHFAPYAQQGLLLPLDGFIRQDNISTEIWSGTQMGVFRTPEGLRALPCFFGTMVYAVNLNDFDSAALSYPQPGWTHTEFATLSGALTRANGGAKRFGAEVEWYAASTNDGESAWLFRAFGGDFINAAGTGVDLTTKAALAAGTWMYEDLLWPGVAKPRQPGQTSAQFGQGLMSMAAVGNWDLARLALATRTIGKWDFYPFPRFPHGRTTFGTDDFYGISAGTKHPDAAWTLLKWLSVESEWQREMIKTQLLSPALLSLWPEWESTVQAVAPVLKDKAIHWFADAATRGEAVPPAYFRYEDAATQDLVGTYFGQIFSRKLSVPEGFRQLQQRVAAMQTLAAQQGPPPTAAALIAARHRELQRLQTMFQASGTPRPAP